MSFNIKPGMYFDEVDIMDVDEMRLDKIKVEPKARSMKEGVNIIYEDLTSCYSLDAQEELAHILSQEIIMELYKNQYSLLREDLEWYSAYFDVDETLMEIIRTDLHNEMLLACQNGKSNCSTCGKLCAGNSGPVTSMKPAGQLDLFGDLRIKPPVEIKKEDIAVNIIDHLQKRQLSVKDVAINIWKTLENDLNLNCHIDTVTFIEELVKKYRSGESLDKIATVLTNHFNMSASQTFGKLEEIQSLFGISPTKTPVYPSVNIPVNPPTPPQIAIGHMAQFPPNHDMGKWFLCDGSYHLYNDYVELCDYLGKTLHHAGCGYVYNPKIQRSPATGLDEWYFNLPKIPGTYIKALM